MTGCHGRKAYAYFSDRFYCQSAAGCKSATICGLLRTTWRSKETTINGIRRARTLFCVLFYLGQNRRENRQLMVKSEENGHIPSEEVDDFEVVGEAPVAVNGDVA